MNFIFGTLLTASGNLKVLNWISFLGILLNIVLNLLLIPKYGALGAAFTTFVTQFFTAILQCVYAIKLFQIPVQIGHWIKYPLLITVLLVLSEFLRDTTILLLTQVTIGSIGMFVLSFISWAAIKEMINEKANKIN
jgi:O-antigen/teichoic acid export membrane protein